MISIEITGTHDVSETAKLTLAVLIADLLRPLGFEGIVGFETAAVLSSSKVRDLQRHSDLILHSLSVGQTHINISVPNP